jgi:hypothetical protein
MKRLRKLVERLERGNGSVVEFIGLVVILVILLDIASMVVIARPAQVTAAGAARACARVAVDTLNGGLGPAQGVAAGQTYLAEAGMEGAVAVHSLHAWDRDAPAQCTVTTEVPAGTIGFVRVFTGRDTIRIEQSSLLSIGAYQARWTAR